ncbi:hypothetical protein P4639_22085 [Priestia megaterium]|uniref:hypothetical protein n=1 Tax=Priestia megaterium TaxID=1404 RepID=UPI002E23490E|nr:hypothetical protein [Priestia megaterium]
MAKLNKYEKAVNYTEGLRKRYKESVMKDIETLQEQVFQLKQDAVSLKKKDNSDYLWLDSIKLTLSQIERTQSQISALDQVRDAHKMIEERYEDESEQKDEVRKIYWYAYRLRGFSIGAQPKDFFSHDASFGKLGAVAYTRELTSDEMFTYDLNLYKIETANESTEWVGE